MKKMIIIVAILVVAAIGTIVWRLTSIPQETQPSMEATPSSHEITYSMKEVKNHSTQDDCWTVIDGSVYDLTGYINRHPGGKEILRACGTDATSLFTERETSEGETVGSGQPHSGAAIQQLNKLKVGSLK